MLENINALTFFYGFGLAIIYLCVRFVFIILPKYKHHKNVSFISAVYGLMITYLLLPIVYIKLYIDFKDIVLLTEISTDLLVVVFLLMVHSIIINFPTKSTSMFLKPRLLLFIPAMAIAIANFFFIKPNSFIINLVCTVYLIAQSLILTFKTENLFKNSVNE